MEFILNIGVNQVGIQAFIAKSLHTNWDLLLPQRLHAIRAKTYKNKRETQKAVTLGRKVKLLADLQFSQDLHELPINFFLGEHRNRGSKT